MLWLSCKEVKAKGFAVRIYIQFIGFMLIIISILGLLIRSPFAPREGKQDPVSKPINCIEHVMVDGQPYCGMIKYNGIAYELTMSDVENSILTADIQR